MKSSTAKQMHQMFTQQMGVHQDLELQEYVQRVGEKLAAVSERPELEWHFTIVDTDDVNAFATMGGYVYISRGILPYFENEADLAAVLGHEIGHISAEHLVKQQHKGALAGLASAATAIFTGVPALADLTNMAGQAIISGYGRDAELEADRLGARYLAKAGYDPARDDPRDHDAEGPGHIRARARAARGPRAADLSRHVRLAPEQ